MKKKKTILATSASFYQENNNFARNFQQTSIYMSLARTILHVPPTKQQLQGSLGKGVFNWAYCHLKQNQDCVSKEGKFILGKQQAMPAKDQRRSLVAVIQFNKCPLGTYTIPCAWRNGFCLRLTRIQKMNLLQKGQLPKQTSRHAFSFIFFPNHQATLSFENAIS